ncbi:MAG TPA: MopE-related protein, partial [Candidatus Polarisedimenticolia bacterium]|nr:MopE-related protein [Candidatus Polarisedimenticolia bacterium]
LRRCTAPDGEAGDTLGRALTAVPDLDGDGLADLAASAPLDDTPRGNDSGSIALVSSSTCGLLTRVGDRIGSTGARLADRSLILAGNLLGDPDVDLIAGSGYDASNAGTVPGRALLLGLESDCDGDGFAPADGDCNDADPAAFPDATEICDGADNDCDAAIDEEDPPEGQPCQTGQPGVCATGTAHCGGGPYTCVPDSTPSPEICDGLDNDCDGVTDEDAGGGTPCSTGLPGVCGTGTTACEGSGPVCVPSVTPSPEICDGFDNDCDAATDEGDPGGGQACLTGLPGACSAGLTRCVGGAIECTPSGTGSPEVCDGADNDCDGATDEGDPGGGGACFTGQPGQCAAGTQHCSGGALACQANAAPEPETCDNLDNDCDGDSDEGNPGGGQACGTGFPGVCGAGVTVCSDGFLDCFGTATPSPEACNGLDDDCDGTTDENNPGGNAACQTGQPGVCAAGTTHCAGGTLACTRNEEPSPEFCDMVDTDCNGVVDDVPDTIDGDGVSDCTDNCPTISNPGQEDTDLDGFGDLCDVCPAFADPTQNICACSVCGPVGTIILDRLSGGNGVLHWQTDVEHSIAGFNVLSIDSRNRVTKLNPTLVPCTECTSDRGASYALPVSKIKSGHSLYVEQVDRAGQVRRFGPAVKP